MEHHGQPTLCYLVIHGVKAILIDHETLIVGVQLYSVEPQLNYPVKLLGEILRIGMHRTEAYEPAAVLRSRPVVYDLLLRGLCGYWQKYALINAPFIEKRCGLAY